MLAQLRMGRLDFLRRTADSPRDRRSCAFRLIAQLACATTQPRRYGEFFDHRVEFLAGGLGTGRIVFRLGPLQLQLQLFDPPSIFASSLGIEHFLRRITSHRCPR